MVVLSTLQPWLSCAMTHNMLFRTFGLISCSLFLSQTCHPTISEGISAVPERPQTIEGWKVCHHRGGHGVMNIQFCILLQFSWKAFLHSYTQKVTEVPVWRRNAWKRTSNTHSIRQTLCLKDTDILSDLQWISVKASVSFYSVTPWKNVCRWYLRLDTTWGRL